MADRAGPGPPADFEAVFIAHQDRLVRLAGLLCGDAGTAEDAVADVFARLYRRWSSGGIQDLDTYLRRAVVNEVRGSFRKGGRAKAAYRREAALAPRQKATRSVADEDHLWRLLLQLPDRQRAVLVLRYFDDLSEARIAEILGMAPGTVKSNAARGLERLRHLLGADDDDS